MLAISGSDLTAILVAVPAILAAIGTLVVSLRSQKKIVSIDSAVNHKETGMPTLVQRLINQDDRGVLLAEDLAQFRKWTQDAFIASSKAQGFELPPIPAAVPPTNVQLPKDAEHPQSDPNLSGSPTPAQHEQSGDKDSLTGTKIP